MVLLIMLASKDLIRCYCWLALCVFLLFVFFGREHILLYSGVNAGSLLGIYFWWAWSNIWNVESNMSQRWPKQINYPLYNLFSHEPLCYSFIYTEMYEYTKLFYQICFVPVGMPVTWNLEALYSHLFIWVLQEIFRWAIYMSEYFGYDHRYMA